jgi:hypothetical protein
LTSTFTTTLVGSIHLFLANLAQQTILPAHIWRLATLSIREGGLGILDPMAAAPYHFARPVFRSLLFTRQSIPSTPLPTASTYQNMVYIQLPVYFNVLPTIPWCTKALELLTSIFRPADPFTLADSINQYENITLPSDINPFQKFKKFYRCQQLNHYEDALPTLPRDFQHAQFSLRSYLTSMALTSLPIAFVAYRIPAPFLVLVIQWKLRLPILQNPTCSCGCIPDPFGDLFFNVRNIHTRPRITGLEIRFFYCALT